MHEGLTLHEEGTSLAGGAVVGKGESSFQMRPGGSGNIHDRLLANCHHQVTLAV